MQLYPSERILVPILTADALLSAAKYQKIISNIPKLVDLQDKEFAILYQQLISNFAQFVQLIPLSNDADLGSLLEIGLFRALAIIQNDTIDPLMTYVLFSASLLFDIGSLTHDRTIIISKEDGTFIKEWAPHKGEMQPSDGGYYRIRHGGNKSLWLSRNLTPILARQLMPTIGFNWIAEDPAAFDIWLSILLNHKEKESNEFKMSFKQVNKKIHEKPALIQPTLPKNIQLLEPQATALGEEFLNWLENGIKNKTIEVNGYNADIHVIENGLFLEMPSTVEKFCLQSALKPSVTQVTAQLKKIGLFGTNEITKYTYKNQIHSSLFSTPTSNIPKKTSKYDTRTGLELLTPYFLASHHKLKLTAEKNFTPEEDKKEKKKKKLLLKRRRERRLRILMKELEEAMHVQAKMNLGLKD